jgi:hypothetical protein
MQLLHVDVKPYHIWLFRNARVERKNNVLYVDFPIKLSTPDEIKHDELLTNFIQYAIEHPEEIELDGNSIPIAAVKELMLLKGKKNYVRIDAVLIHEDYSSEDGRHLKNTVIEMKSRNHLKSRDNALIELNLAKSYMDLYDRKEFLEIIAAEFFESIGENPFAEILANEAHYYPVHNRFFMTYPEGRGFNSIRLEDL